MIATLVVLVAASFILHGIELWVILRPPKRQEPENVAYSTPDRHITILRKSGDDWVAIGTRESIEHPDYPEALSKPDLAVQHADGRIELGNQVKKPCQ